MPCWYPSKRQGPFIASSHPLGTKYHLSYLCRQFAQLGPERALDFRHQGFGGFPFHQAIHGFHGFQARPQFGGFLEYAGGSWAPLHAIHFIVIIEFGSDFILAIRAKAERGKIEFIYPGPKQPA